MERCNERFFDMPVGCWCGVLVREDVARKLQKILWRQTQEIKDFLIRNMDALETSNWTLAYIPEQTAVFYFDKNSREELEHRIAFFDKADRLKFIPDVFRTDSTSIEAMKEIEAFYTEHYGSGEGGDAI